MNIDAIISRLAIVIEQRICLRMYGWGETPALDAEIAELESLLCR